VKTSGSATSWRRGRILVAALGLLGALACGAGAGAGGNALPFDMTVSRAVADQATSFQIVLLANGSSYDCATLAQTCLENAGVRDADFVRLTDPSGQQKKALIVPNTLADGGVQEVVLQDLQPGKDFAVVVDAIAGNQLVSANCKYVSEIRSGPNAGVLINLGPLASGVTCDPTVR
jgi:hypothetical protein